MTEESRSAQNSEIAKGLLKDYFQGVRNLESAQTLSLVSLILSILFVSKVFGFFILNLLYLANISFFALIVRDSWSIRKKNLLPIAIIVISIALTSMLLVDVLKMMDVAATLRNSFEN
jgi:hypothetical protein